MLEEILVKKGAAILCVKMRHLSILHDGTAYGLRNDGKYRNSLAAFITVIANLILRSM